MMLVLQILIEKVTFDSLLYLTIDDIGVPVGWHLGGRLATTLVATINAIFFLIEEKMYKIMAFIVATNVVAGWLTDWNADRWNAARSRQ